MTDRLTRQLVTFLHPFHLDEIEDELPPGTYEVETEHERLEGASFCAYRRVSTVFVVRPTTENGMSKNRYITIDPVSLEAATNRDLAQAAAEQTAWNREITARSSEDSSQVIRLPNSNADTHPKLVYSR